MTAELDQLNKQAIMGATKHMGHIAWPTIGLTLCVVLAYAANLLAFAFGMLPAWAATFILGILTYFSYTPLHEAAHGNIHGKQGHLKWVNDLCGFLVAPLIAIPYASHKLEHFTHHRYTNQPGKDPDYVISGLRNGIRALLPITLKFFWTQNIFFVSNHWALATLKEKLVYCTEIFVSIFWRVGFVLAVAQPNDVIVILVGYLVGGSFTAYWFAYRPHLPYDNHQRYQNTNSLIAPVWLKPFEWFWLGQNLHSIHHLFPRVPFYRYHALHKEIEPVLREKGTPIIGIFDRKPV